MSLMSVRAAKALTRLCGCTVSSEASLLACASHEMTPRTGDTKTYFQNQFVEMTKTVVVRQTRIKVLHIINILSFYLNFIVILSILSRSAKPFSTILCFKGYVNNYITRILDDNIISKRIRKN